MRNEIKKSIVSFINNEERVLCINGAWGIGKTYLIDEIINEFNDNKHKNSQRIIFRKTKLFGLKNINDLVFSLFFNGNVNFLIGITNIFKQLKAHVPYLKSFNIDVSVSSFINDKTLDILKNKKEIICIIDDIERKNKDILIDELFGFVDLIKHKIKFILIMNKEQLDKESENMFNTYKEKIIDRTITINCAEPQIYISIFEDEGKASNDKKIKMLKKCGIFDIKNMRTVISLKNILNIIKINIYNEDVVIIFKVKLIACLLDKINNNKYSRDALLEKRADDPSIIFAMSLGNNRNTHSASDIEIKKKEYKEKEKMIVDQMDDVECFCEYFVDDEIFSKVTPEEFKRVARQCYDILLSGLYDKLSDINISITNNGRESFASNNLIAFYSDNPSKTALDFLQDVQNAINKKNISQISIMKNYVDGILQNYQKYYKNNDQALKMMKNIDDILITDTAKEIVYYKNCNIDIYNRLFFDYSEEVKDIIKSKLYLLYNAIYEEINIYYSTYRFESYEEINNMLKFIENINVVLRSNTIFEFSKECLNNILSFVFESISNRINQNVWTNAHCVLEELYKNNDKEVLNILKDKVIVSEEPLKERIDIIIQSIESK